MGIGQKTDCESSSVQTPRAWDGTIYCMGSNTEKILYYLLNTGDPTRDSEVYVSTADRMKTLSQAGLRWHGQPFTTRKEAEEALRRLHS